MPPTREWCFLPPSNFAYSVKGLWEAERIKNLWFRKMINQLKTVYTHYVILFVHSFAKCNTMYKFQSILYLKCYLKYDDAYLSRIQSKYSLAVMYFMYMHVVHMINNTLSWFGTVNMNNFNSTLGRKVFAMLISNIFRAQRLEFNHS